MFLKLRSRVLVDDGGVAWAGICSIMRPHRFIMPYALFSRCKLLNNNSNLCAGFFWLF